MKQNLRFPPTALWKDPGCGVAARLSLGPAAIALTRATSGPSPRSHKHVTAVVC